MTAEQRPSLGSGAHGRAEARTETTSGASWSTSATRRLEPLALASLSVGAAAIHFGVTAEHFTEDLRFGLFFSAVGWFEALWALAYVLRPVRWLAALGALGSAATVAVWVWAHIVGLPFGPDVGSVEPTTVTDLMATLFELVLTIWLLLVLAVGRKAAPNVNLRTSWLAVGALIVAIGVAVTVALAI